MNINLEIVTLEEKEKLNYALSDVSKLLGSIRIL